MKTHTPCSLDARLEAWGEWCLQHQLPELGYPSASFEFRHWLRSGVKLSAFKTPDFPREEETERWVKVLNERHPTWARVLRYHYTTAGPTTTKARVLKLPYTTYREQLLKAKACLQHCDTKTLRH